MKKVIFCVLFGTVSMFVTAQTRYVTETGSGNQSGLSWKDASPDLQLMINQLAITAQNSVICVAAGTYIPIRPADNLSVVDSLNPDNAFVLNGTIDILGGYSALDTTAPRDWAANPTILEGRINSSEVRHHIVMSVGSNARVHLEGFIIQVFGTSLPTTNEPVDPYFISVNGHLIYSGWGGGMLIYAASHLSPLLANIIVRGVSNSGIYIAENSTPIIYGALIHSNFGGGIRCINSSPTILSSTISKNSTKVNTSGRGMYNENSTPAVVNSIIYGNEGLGIMGAEVQNINSVPAYYHSLVKGETQKDTNNNLDGDTDPLFNNPNTNDFTLNMFSPCIDKGNYFYITPQDLACSARVVGAMMDIGAYENQYPRPMFKIMYVNKNVMGGNNSGDSWQNAKKDLSEALIDARLSDSVSEVWVAQGGYTPSQMPAPYPNEMLFLLSNGIALYGGFPPDANDVDNAPASPTSPSSLTLEQARNTRDWETYPTILDGKDSSYHVVLALNCQDTAIIDGFTIQNGLANGSATTTIDSCNVSRMSGGGMAIYASNVKIKDLRIKNNTALNDGGGIYCNFSSIFLENISIDSNATTNPAGGSGGGIYCINSFAVLDSVDIADNISRNGGGLYLYSSEIKGRKANIFQNQATYYGGGIYMSGESRLLNLNVYKNFAVNAGGGIYHSVSKSNTLENIAVINNITNDGIGSGIYNYFSGNDTISTSFVNLTICGNKDTSGGEGDGIYNAIAAYNTSYTLNVYNSVIAENIADVTNNSNFHINYYSCAYDNGDLPPYSTTNHHLSLSQMNFADAANGDYHINYDGALADRGNDAYLSPDNTADPDGNPRISGTCVDIGAYEAIFEQDTLGIIYVNQNVTTGNRSGVSWYHAMDDLAAPLNAARTNPNIKQIWVAAGTYTPKYQGSGGYVYPANTLCTFFIPEGLKLYGGFAGWEDSISQRKLKENPTILSGDLGGGRNSQHVVLFFDYGDVDYIDSNNNTIFKETLLSGFIVQGGKAKGGSGMYINNRYVKSDCGAGIYNCLIYDGAMFTNLGQGLSVEHCIIRNNEATSHGGGIYSSGGQHEYIENHFVYNWIRYRVHHSLIYGNTAASGAGMYNEEHCLLYDLINSTIANNNAVGSGGGICNENTDQLGRIRGSIIKFNQGGDLINHHISLNYLSIYASLIGGVTFEGMNLLDDGQEFNLYGSKDPLFVDMANHNYRLQLSSPCINTGWLGIGLKEMDLDGYSRVYQARGDMGAYERTLIPDTDGRIYVNQNAPTGDGLGTSWQDAVSELAFPMIAAIYDPSIREIWTAGGTYYPNMYNISPRSTITLPIFPFPSNMVNAASFILPKELAVYGGFAGTETDIEDRDLKSNTTVLSGNLNTIAGGVIHVVLSMNNDNTSTLDGFTIYGGKLDNTSLDYIYDIPNSSIYLRTKNNCGAGIYNYNSNAQYRNLVIADNQTRYQGGGMYNEESSPTLDNVTLLTNKAQQGGGMYNYASSPAVTNSFISNNTAQESGGGIYNEKSSLSLSGVTINGNQAQNLYGGGIYNDWSSSLEFENGIIRSNEALAGGGITNWGDLFLADASIYGNTARNDGGGVYNGGTALLESVQIYDNHADNDGGGCYNYMSSPVLNDVQIYDNHANENGGGFYNINNAYPEFSNVKIFNNAASRGGGFFNRQSNFELTGVAITENTANNHGGGIYMCDWGGLDIVNIPITNNFAGSNGGGVYNLHEPFRLVNVLLTGNHALNAGAVYVQQGDGEMINVTISGNNNAISNFQAITHNNNRLNIYNSIIYGNSGSAGIKPSGFYHSLIENITLSGTPENNLDWWLNPQFVNIQLGDYQLDNNSPCIDAGNNAYIGQRLWGLDLAGNPRWQGASIDMGAYEFASGPSPAPPPPAPPHDSIADNRSPQKPVSNPLAYGDLEIYPNPTTGKLSVVSYQLSEMIGDVEIFDVVGRKLLSLPSPLSPEIEIDISHLANGMYFLKIDGKVKKVIKY